MTRTTDEESLVAELELLGITYLSRQSSRRAAEVRPPAQLLADLIRQPSPRVRQSVISVLLAHPAYSAAIPAALRQLSPDDSLTLRLFYTAAVLLQQKYVDELRQVGGHDLVLLPDLFSTEFGVSATDPIGRRIDALADTHRRATSVVANWAGTYENVARKLLRRWEMERRWSQLPRKSRARL